MVKHLALICGFVLFVAACDEGTTTRKPWNDNGGLADADQMVTDEDSLLSDELLNDDGQLVNDDGQLVDDDGQLVNDDGQLISDDGEPITDDGEVITDDGTVVTDDNEPVTDDGTVVTDDGVVITDDGVVFPDDDTVANCGDNSDCKPTEYCAKPDGTCDAYLAGTCTLRPEMCQPMYAPVCGCDGITYQNKCDAAASGVNVDYSGECVTTPGCYANDECVSGGTTPQFCLFEPGACWGPGTCTDYPSSCPKVYAPVCGCDNATYPNECYAYQAGQSVQYEGECQEEKYSTLYYYYDQNTMNAPDAEVVVVTADGDEIEFVGADLMTRTPFGTYPNNGVYLRTTFYGTTDDGSKIEFQLKVWQSGFSLPKVYTLDGVDNYARWTRLGNQLVGNLYGDVTLYQYQRNTQGIITLIEISGDYLTFVPN